MSPAPGGSTDAGGGQRLLVDAMNVMGARPDGWWRDRDAALRRLVASLDRYAARTGAEVTIVADGRPPVDLPEGPHGAVRLQYARRGGADAADDRIVELAAEASPGTVVVTADRELRRRVRALGLEAMGPRELLGRLDADEGAG